MTNLPAKTGWLWIRQGFQYFKQQPMEFISLFLAYLFFVLIIGLISYGVSGLIPHIGQLLTFICLPLFTLPFMQACKGLDQGQRVHPLLMMTGLRSPQLPSLLMLGLLYLLAAWVALLASTLIDGGLFMQLLTESDKLDPSALEDSAMAAAMLFAMLIYGLALMALWFAAPLIAWQEMPLFKAIFYSFFSALKCFPAFIVYALSWFAVAGIAPAILMIMVASMTGSQDAVVMLMLPVSLISNVILYCTFYPSYKSMFGQTETVSSTIS